MEVKDTKSAKRKADYIFEPDKEQLLETLVPSILQLSFHKTVLDTQAGEHGARMTAMDKATDNAEELLKTLRINYNKARQEANAESSMTLTLDGGQQVKVSTQTGCAGTVTAPIFSR